MAKPVARQTTAAAGCRVADCNKIAGNSDCSQEEAVAAGDSGSLYSLDNYHPAVGNSHLAAVRLTAVAKTSIRARTRWDSAPGLVPDNNS